MFAPPILRTAVVHAGNVNEVLSSAGFADDADLFCLDIDGQDYWVWQALDSRPRVVVVEFNPAWGAAESMAVPRRDVTTSAADLAASHYGASLEAFARLGSLRGYRLVATSSLGSNAVFVRADLPGAGRLAALSTADALSRPAVARRRSRTVAARDRGVGRDLSRVWRAGPAPCSPRYGVAA